MTIADKHQGKSRRERRLERERREMELSRALHTFRPTLSDDKEREMFYFLQVFHPERGEKANRKLAKERKQ